jgi:hypothetical protein
LALLVLVEHKWAEPLSEAMGDLEGVAFRETLSDALVAQLLEAESSEA